MRFSRTASWKFREPDSQFLHLALYARDVAGLDVTPSEEIPPHLAGELHSRDRLVPPSQEVLAARQWRTWWDRLLRHVVSQANQPEAECYPDLDDLLTTMRQDRQDVFDPPDFRTLADLPAARAVAVATFGPGLEWLNRQQRLDVQGSRQQAFPSEVVRDTAESVAAERGVPLSELRATVHTLSVEGLWTYLVAPGCALCSSATAASPDAARQLLRGVFGSHAP